MAITQLRSKRTNTGSRYTAARKKKQRELGNMPTLTKVEPKRVSVSRTIGGNSKTKLLSGDIANVFDAKTKKMSKVKITTVSDNPANRNYTRRNIITKGAVLETEKGQIKVTNRPGQEGTINAVFM